MQINDMERVLDIQAVCYTDIVPESRQSMQAKLEASPSTCFVAFLEAQIVGYILSVPWIAGAPPALDAPECRLPENPDCLYLHDLAILPAARKCAAGTALVQSCLDRLAPLSLGRAALIAIQASSPYWQRHGFRIVALPASMHDKLASYGPTAVYMEFLRSELINTPLSE